MSSNYQKIRHKRSGVQGKRPTPDILSAGEISLNYNSQEVGLFISTSSETISKIGPTYIGDTAPNANPPSGGYAYNSNGEEWFQEQTRILKVYNESAGEWQDVLSPLAAQSKNVITVSQDSEYATDAMFNTGKVRPFATLQRALLQVARESVQKDPLTDDANYTIYVAPGRYSIPNKGSSLTAVKVDISSNRYGDSSVGFPQNSSAVIRFTFSEEPAAFDLSMVTAAYGTLSNLQQNSNYGYIYTATFTRTDDTNYGIITVTDGAFQSKDGTDGLGAQLNLATVAQPTSAVSIYERGDDYIPTDADYERLNVNEGLIIPRGTCIIGANQRSVYFTGNYNSRSQDRTSIFKVTQESQIRDITVIDKADSGLVLMDEEAAQLDRVRFTEPHGLRNGDIISFTRFGGADIYSPLIYNKQYNIVKVDDYTVELYLGDRKVSIVEGSAGASSGVVAKYSVDRSNLTLVNVHGFELASNAELTEYYSRVASELFQPGTKLYTNPEVWESTAVAPTTQLEVDSVRKGSVYFKDISVRSRYGMSGWLIDGAKNTGLKSAHLAGCTLVSLQTEPTAWEVYNASTNAWEAPAGATTDEQRQSVIDAALNGIRVKTPRNADGTVDSDNDNRFFLVCATNQAYVSAFSCFAVGASDHYLALNGGYVSAHSSVSNFGGVGLVAEGFAGLGTTGGALEQDTGWFIEGFLRPLKVSVAEAADNATEVSLGVSITEILANDGVSTDSRLTSDNIAPGETALYFDKFYSETVPLPFSVVPSSAVYTFAPNAYYRAMLTADPFIRNIDGAIVGFRTSSTNNAIANLGTGVIGEELLIRRFVDPRTDIERNPQILIQGKDQQPVQKNHILRLTSGGKGTNGTQLIKQGVQIDPVLNSDSSHVFEVVDFTTKELGENPNEVLRSFNNIFAPTNEFYVTLQQNGEFGPWDAGKNYVRGDFVSYGNKNYVCASPVVGGANPDVSPYWLNSQTYQQGVEHINSVSSVGLTVNVINKDDGTRSMGITEDDLNPAYHPVQRAVRKFMELLGVSSSDINTVLRPETRANRLFTVNDMLTAGMQLTGAGFATQVGTWPVEFNRPSTVSAVSHSWDLCGYWNYSTALPVLRDSQLTAREELDFLHSEAQGGLVFASGLTDKNELVFTSLFRDLHSGGLYDIRQGGGGKTLFATSSETDVSREVYYQTTAPFSPEYGTIWIDSSLNYNILKFWDGSAWVVANEGQAPAGIPTQRPANPSLGDFYYNTASAALEYWDGTSWRNIAGITSFNGRYGNVTPAEGDYSLEQLSDVSTSGATVGQVLKYDGTSWAPANDDDTVYTLPTSSETVVGGVELATQTETNAGTDTTRAVTPAKLAGYTTNVLDARYSATGSGVLSFNGRTGAITPAEGDYDLGELGDVNTAGATAGQVLKYDGTTWAPAADNTLTTLDSLTDVSTTGVTTGQVLKYDGTQWVPQADNTLTTLDSLTDVNTAGATNGQVLKFNGLSWVPGTDLDNFVPTPDYGSFLSTVTQSVTAVNVGQPVTMNATAYSNNFSIVNGSRITANNAGVYNLQFSAQLVLATNPPGFVEFWLVKNGTAIGNSNRRIEVTTVGDAVVASLDYIEVLQANDYLELYWGASDTDVQIKKTSSSMGGPDIPSVMLTILPVGA